MPNRILAAFLAVLLSGSARAAEFQPPNGSELTNAIGRQFVRPMLQLAEDAPVDEFYGWLQLDVDGDGYGELFIKLSKAEFCSETGCPIVAFKRRPDESWLPILTAVGDGVDLADGRIVVRAGTDRQSYIYDAESSALVPSGD